MGLQILDEKCPTILEKLPQNLGGFFLTHTVQYIAFAAIMVLFGALK